MPYSALLALHPFLIGGYHVRVFPELVAPSRHAGMHSDDGFRRLAIRPAYDVVPLVRFRLVMRYRHPSGSYRGHVLPFAILKCRADLTSILKPHCLASPVNQTLTP